MTQLFDSINSHIKNFEDQLYTACPAVVEKYNPANCTVDVYPAVWKAYKDGVLVKEQILTKVPLHFQAAKDIGFTFPIQKGDTVLLVFSHSDTEGWLTNPQEYVRPKTYRKHNINDAFAIAGVFKYNNTPVKAGTENDVNIYHKDSYVRLKSNGDIKADTSTGQSVELLSSGNVNVDASGDIDVTAGGTATVTATTVNVLGDDITLKAPKVTIDSDDINFGIGGSPAGVARIGDVVTIGAGSSAGTWPITSGSSFARAK